MSAHTGLCCFATKHGGAFSGIAKEYGISAARAARIYNQIKIRQIRLYIRHISAVLGLESTKQIGKIYMDAFECYQDWSYSCAYLEKKYEDILTGYREGGAGYAGGVYKKHAPVQGGS